MVSADHDGFLEFDDGSVVDNEVIIEGEFVTDLSGDSTIVNNELFIPNESSVTIHRDDGDPFDVLSMQITSCKSDCLINMSACCDNQGNEFDVIVNGSNVVDSAQDINFGTDLLGIEYLYIEVYNTVNATATFDNIEVGSQGGGGASKGDALDCKDHGSNGRDNAPGQQKPFNDKSKAGDNVCK